MTDEVLARLQDRLEFADFLRPIIKHAEFAEWFDGQERKLVESVLRAPLEDEAGRIFAIQTIHVLRDMRGWLEASVRTADAQGRQMREKSRGN